MFVLMMDRDDDDDDDDDIQTENLEFVAIEPGSLHSFRRS